MSTRTSIQVHHRHAVLSYIRFVYLVYYSTEIFQFLRNPIECTYLIIATFIQLTNYVNSFVYTMSRETVIV